MPLPDTTPETLPATCNVRSWVVWAPGFHKDELYGHNRSEQIVTNFDYLTTKLRHTIPQAGIGHDQQQRFAKSLGFLSVGQVTGCRAVPGHDGYFEIDVRNVPTEVGAEVNAGRLCSGSAELKNHIRDPKDPAKEVPGDVLTGVAFLGDEQPAIRVFPPELMERSRPHATFDNGSPVPPSPSPARWLNAMADVTKALAAEYRGEFDPTKRTARIKGREYAAATVCFSDFTPDPGPTMNLTPELEAALIAAGVSPEQIAQAKAAGAGAPPAAVMAAPVAGAGAPPVADTDGDMMSMCKKFAEDPAATPEQKMMAAVYADNAEMKKRIGAFEASAEANAKKDEEAKMAAFSAQVETECSKIVKKVAPHIVQTVIKPQAIAILTAKHFAAETDRVKAFSDFFAGFAMLPDNPQLAKNLIADAKGTGKNAAPNSSETLTALIGPGSLLDRQFGTADMRQRLNVA